MTNNTDDLKCALENIDAHGRTALKKWNQPNERGSTLREILKMKRSVAVIEVMHKRRCGWDDAVNFFRGGKAYESKPKAEDTT